MLRKGMEAHEGKAVVWVCELGGVAPTARWVRKIRDEQRAQRTIEGNRPYRLAKGEGKVFIRVDRWSLWFIFWVVPARSVKRVVPLSYLKVKRLAVGMRGEDTPFTRGGKLGESCWK